MYTFLLINQFVQRKNFLIDEPWGMPMNRTLGKPMFIDLVKVSESGSKRQNVHGRIGNYLSIAMQFHGCHIL